MSPFVLQKIRERKAEAAREEPEEIEEPEAEEAEEHEEREEEREEREELPEPPPKKSHHAIGERSSHGSRSGARAGASLTDRAQKFFKNLGPTQTWLLIGGGLLVANHLMVPRGTSVLSKMMSAIAPTPPPPPRLRQYPSNWEAGWSRPSMPYGAQSWGW